MVIFGIMRFQQPKNPHILQDGEVQATNSSDESFGEIRKYIEELSSNYDEVIEIHGFYVYAEKNIISFDLIVDFDSNREQVKDELLQKLNEKYGDYQFIIVDDYDISD